jgi:SAM-dependent methyltransferase
MKPLSMRVNDFQGPGYYDYLDFNAPLSGRRADSIALALSANGPNTILDIGCGWGELLLRTVAASAGARGHGIDNDGKLISRARANAETRGLSSLVTFEVGAAETVRATADVVICVGADHAFGSQQDALSRLYDLTVPGGRLLFGSGYWQSPPTPDQAASVGLSPDSLLELAGLVDLAVAEGFQPTYIQTANGDEWEEFESGFLADREEWLVDHSDHPDAKRLRAASDKHRSEWLRGYGAVLGFAYLTLGRPASKSGER